MGNFRLPLVADTNVWVDLHVGGLLREAFVLPHTWLVADVITAEVHSFDLAVHTAVGLQIHELSPPLVVEVAQLSARYARSSRVDLCALVLARAHGATLVTGEGALRSAADARL